jgi:hypothetical protein
VRHSAPVVGDKVLVAFGYEHTEHEVIDTCSNKLFKIAPSHSMLGRWVPLGRITCWNGYYLETKMKSSWWAKVIQFFSVSNHSL